MGKIVDGVELLRMIRDGELKNGDRIKFGGVINMDFDECCAEIPEPCFGCSWEDYEPHTNCIKEHFRNEVLKDE